jgi:hypothetical protein
MSNRDVTRLGEPGVQKDQSRIQSVCFNRIITSYFQYISDLFICRQNILAAHLNVAVSSLRMDAISIGISEEVVLR